MERNITKQLISWHKNKNKKPLLIKGARQVGKTYIIREFGRQNYSSIVEINFERQLNFVDFFQTTRDPQEFLLYLQLSFFDTTFDENTLLFLDEIQACPFAITALKFLAEDFPCDIICSGSMLGVAIANSTSFPVGYVETWDMHPLSFHEFLKALKIEDEIISTLQVALDQQKTIPEMIHKKMNEIFTTYLITGGMPEVVAKYLETKSFKDTLLIQRRIVNDYYNDMAKYASGTDRIKARECYSSIPLQLAKDNKKFQYSVVKKGYNARHFDSSLRWLEDSGLIIRTHRLNSISKPLEANIEISTFKIYLADTGLLISQFDESTIRDLLTGDLGVYKGAIYENIVAQIFHALNKKNYYFEPSNSSEIDFITYYNGNIVPIEVKSSFHTQSISLNNFIEKYNSKKAFRFSMKNIGINNTNVIEYLPLYLLQMVLENEKPLQ